MSFWLTLVMLVCVTSRGSHFQKSPYPTLYHTNYSVQDHSQAHSSRSPTHAHSHPRPQCGRCRERLPPRAQLHTGTELSASQARSSVEPSGRPTVRAPARLRPWAVAHGARCSAKLSKHPFPNSCPLSPTPTVWEWPRAVATAQPHIGTATATRSGARPTDSAGKEPEGDRIGRNTSAAGAQRLADSATGIRRWVAAAGRTRRAGCCACAV